MTQHLGRRPLVNVVDHGEPPAGPSPGRDARADASLDKRYHASLARRVFSTSPASRDALFEQETVLLAHDRPPEAAWSDAWAERRPVLLKMFGFTGRFIVIATVGIDEDDGFEDFVACAIEYSFTDLALATRPFFVVAGRSPLTGPAERIPADLVTFVDLGEADLIELLVAADLYLTPQRWQGANCDIALALAMGLPVVASEISAHRAYSIATASDVPGFCRLIGSHAERWRVGAVHWAAVITAGADPLAVLADTISLDLDRDSAEHWI